MTAPSFNHLVIVRSRLETSLVPISLHQPTSNGPLKSFPSPNAVPPSVTGFVLLCQAFTASKSTQKLITIDFNALFVLTDYGNLFWTLPPEADLGQVHIDVKLTMEVALGRQYSKCTINMPPQTRNQGKRQMRSQGNLQSVTLSTVPQAKVKAKPSGPRTRKLKMNITDERLQSIEDGREQEEHEQPAKAKHKRKIASGGTRKRKLPAQAKHSHKGAEEVQEQEEWEGEEQEQEQDEQDDNNEDLPQPKPPKRQKTVASRVSHSGPNQSTLSSVPRPFLATAFAEPLSLISAPDDLEEDDDGLSAAVLAWDVEKVASICQVYRNKAWAHTPEVARALARLPYVDQTIDPLDDDVLIEPTDIQEYIMQNDPLGAVGVFLHASYMFRELTGNFLPEICHMYTQRFSDPLSLEGIMWRNMDAIMTLNTEELEKQANAQRALDLEPSRPTQLNCPSTREDPLMLTQQAVDKGKGKGKGKEKAVEDDKPNDEPDVKGHGPGKSKDRGTKQMVGEKGKEKARAREDDEVGQEGNGDIDNMFSDDDGDDHDESGLKCFGPLLNKLKSIIDALHADYEHNIIDLAEQWGYDQKRLFDYFHPHATVPRDLNHWNIFESWYKHHGEQKKPENLTRPCQHCKVVRDEFNAFLKSKLSNAELEDPEARSEALKDQIEWYEANLETYIESQKQSGKMGKMLKQILRPVIDMSQKIYCETGYEIGGYAIHPQSESVIWVGTDTLESVKTTHGTQMITQANQIAALVHVQKMVENNIDSELAELSRHCQKEKGKAWRDVHRSLIPRVFLYDTKRLIDSGAFNFKPSKLQPTLFVDNAWRAKCRIVNWPVGVSFLNCGVKTSNGFEKGVLAVRDYKTPAIGKIA
ncbi:hypothetical protein F5050DRAFT_1812827 [Lentinula boryana]|uniref:Uncharacterized protein n=1 Tax=Lentinula boryana TaxID=40481 RepID=A0ABQ8PXQ3_9AGAR|nr:hypothetical protein F5050DRAFT_1812827 [Lentinula boryana]